MKRRNELGVTIFASTILSAGVAWSADAGLDVIDDFIREVLQIINSWQGKALFALLIALTIGVFGFLTGALQKFEASWIKIATAVCGILIGCLTVISNTVFDRDHRQFRSMARDGQSLLADIKLIRSQYAAASPEDQRAMLEDVRAKVRRVYQLEQIYQLQRETASSLISVAYAGGLPPWINHLPSDKDNFYFIGISDSRSYESAKQTSKENALDEARTYFVSVFEKGAQSQVDNETLSSYLVKSAQVQDTHFVYDSRSATYRYYTLLRVNKQIVNADLRLFSVGKKASVPATYSKAVQQAQRSPDDYLSRRVDIHTRLLDSARQSLSADQYAKYIKARELRKEKQYDKAIALLSDLVREQNDFYLGWYNLALNYDDKKDFNKAKKAYERAVELEPKQPARDASLYNSYGYFLYKYKDYQDATRYLNRAVEIDPAHPTAAKTLQAAAQQVTR
jgi:tetratricopeptide (TPR) repeat protein